MLAEAEITEPARYYHAQGSIVLRKGMLLEEQRRYLWHELVHADRGDTACGGWLLGKVEDSVEREAARRAMPLSALERAVEVSVDWHELVWLMKVPEPWVRFRLKIAHPAERALLERGCRWASEHTA